MPMFSPKSNICKISSQNKNEYLYFSKQESNFNVFTKVKVERRQICGKLMHQVNNLSHWHQSGPNGLGRVWKTSLNSLGRQICPTFKLMIESGMCYIWSYCGWADLRLQLL